MTEIVGPLGFTDMDPEGMLTWGFDQLGTMPTIYNYEYYPRHIEEMGGFEVDNRYVEYKLYVPDEIPEKFAKIGEMIQKRYNLRIKKLTKKDIFEDNYGERVFQLINETYKDLYGYSQLSQRQMDQYVKMYFQWADLNLITLIEDASADNKLVGLGISIPSLTRALQKCRRGRLLPFGWWHVFRAIKYHKTKVVDLLLIGVLPEYRRMGAAEKILKQGLEEAAERHMEVIFLEVRVSNLPAQSLYRKHNFQTVSVRQDVYELPRENGYIMSRKV